MDWECASRTIAVLAVLAGFGIGFDRLVSRMERRRGLDGYRAVLVVGGVLGTGIGFVVASGSVEAGVLLMACFLASGLPMLWGDIRREGQRRREVEDVLLGETLAALERVRDERSTKTGGVH